MRKYLSIINEIMERVLFLMLCFACGGHLLHQKKILPHKLKRNSSEVFMWLYHVSSLNERKSLQAQTHVVLFHWSCFILAKLLGVF